jgi:hypothetical protein
MTRLLNYQPAKHNILAAAGGGFAWPSLWLGCSWFEDAGSACGRGRYASEEASASAVSIFARVPASQEMGHGDRYAGH